MSQRTIRVLCVDDNFLVAEGIRIKLENETGFEWLGQLRDADRLVDEVKRLEPDVVLLDLDMPGRSPFDALTEVTALGLPTRVLIVSGHVRSELIDRAVDAGAWGYVSKGEEAESIVHAIEQVVEGRFVLGPEAAAEYHAA